MNKYLASTLALVVILHFSGVFSELILLFKDDAGKTNWQHVANWSSGVLIILLSITVTVLFFSRQAKEKANSELNDIKDRLELKVEERTATLADSNRKLKEEVAGHLMTTKQLHESEHYINSILISMPSMLVGLNPEGIITQWNEKAEKYTGVKSTDAIGKDLWDAYPIITVTRDQVNDTLGQKTPTTIRQSQRGLFHFDITIYPLHDSKESGVVLLLDDVSQQVKSENQLIQRDKLSSMGELASSMAHDMNVPLTQMISDIQEIKQRVSSIPENKYITEISERLIDAGSQGKHASAIIENLLDFAGSQLDDKQAVAMTEIMDHSIELAGKILSLPSGIKFKDIQIDREYDKKLPKINCRESEIQQVFLSLLRHCYHAIADRINEDKGMSFEPKIRIRALEGYDSLWLQISHNGKGLTSEEQQSIFEPYFSNQPLDQRNDANKRLSFPHFVVTEHHTGQMAVTSDLKLGTTFHMQFS